MAGNIKITTYFLAPVYILKELEVQVRCKAQVIKSLRAELRDKGILHERVPMYTTHQ